MAALRYGGLYNRVNASLGRIARIASANKSLPAISLYKPSERVDSGYDSR